MSGRKPSEESWNEKVQRLDNERQAEENARRNEPTMVKVNFRITFDSMFGWIRKLKAKMKKPKNKKLPLLLLSCLPVILCNCSVTSARSVGADGVSSSFFTGAVGGKGGIAGVKTPAIEFDAMFYDNEKSFRDGVIGLVTYGVASVIGSAVEAGQAAKTAQNAANQSAGIANAKTAAQVANTKTTAGLIKDVGMKGEVPIKAIALP